MRLPTKGLCHSVFILSYLARSKPRKNISDWISAVKNAPTIMGESLAIQDSATYLLDLGLAKVDGQCINIDRDLSEAGEEASMETLAAVARVLLRARPPAWMDSAVVNGVVRDEFIPTADEQALSWLGDMRDLLLVDIKNNKDQSEEFQKWLGGVGEAIIVESERQQGRQVRQVSRISDSFGFDIESRSLSRQMYIEVKTAIESTADHFYISKNEVSKAIDLNARWCLVQVILSRSVLTDSSITEKHIKKSRFLDADALIALVPTDTPSGVWIESARITPPADAWSRWDMRLPESWKCSGYLA